MAELRTREETAAKTALGVTEDIERYRTVCPCLLIVDAAPNAVSF